MAHSASHAHHGGALHTSGWFYDIVVQWFVTRGREHGFRQMTLDLLQLTPGEHLLDVGCGTGTLALAAGERVGATGHVVGIDPSPRLLSRARRKATRRGSSVEFQVAGFESLGLPNQSFDAVVGTFMLHHVPDELVRRGFAEVARVLKPGGRLLLIDFVASHAHGHGPDPERIGIKDAPHHLREVGLEAAPMQDLTARFALKSLSPAHRSYGYVMATKQPPDADSPS